MHNVHRVAGVAPVSEALQWLSRAMAETRAQHGLELIDIAYHARVKEGTVARWENAQNWPRELDAALAAYAKAAGLSGSRDVWELALQLWREDDMAAGTPGDAVIDLLRESGQPAADTEGGLGESGRDHRATGP